MISFLAFIFVIIGLIFIAKKDHIGHVLMCGAQVFWAINAFTNDNVWLLTQSVVLFCLSLIIAVYWFFEMEGIE